MPFFRRGISLFGLIYIIAGLYIAWIYDYITVPLLKNAASAFLAVLLWFLVLLGVNFNLG